MGFFGLFFVIFWQLLAASDFDRNNDENGSEIEVFSVDLEVFRACFFNDFRSGLNPWKTRKYTCFFSMFSLIQAGMMKFIEIHAKNNKK